MYMGYLPTGSILTIIVCRISSIDPVFTTGPSNIILGSTVAKWVTADSYIPLDILLIWTILCHVLSLIQAMSYVSVRGNLGGTICQVEGLSEREAHLLSSVFPRGAKSEFINEISFYTPVINIINQLEFAFGYEVVSCTNSVTSGVRGQYLTMWTLFRPGHQNRWWCYVW